VALGEKTLHMRLMGLVLLVISDYFAHMKNTASSDTAGIKGVPSSDGTLDPGTVAAIEARALGLLNEEWCSTLCRLEGVDPSDVRNAIADEATSLTSGAQLYQLGRRVVENQSRVVQYQHYPRAFWAAIAFAAATCVPFLVLAATTNVNFLFGLYLLFVTAWPAGIVLERARRKAGLQSAPAELSQSATDLDRRLLVLLERLIRDSAHPAFAPPQEDIVAMGDGASLSSRTKDGQRIATKYRVAVESHITRIGGGVVGVTGERGIGKSEVLLSLAGSPTPKPTVEDGGTIVVYVAAPAAFDGIEFLRLAIRRLIESIPGYENVQSESIRRRRRASLISALVGLVLLLVCVVGASLRWAPRITITWLWASGAVVGLVLYMSGLRAFVRSPSAHRVRTKEARGAETQGASLIGPRQRIARDAKTAMNRVRYAETISSAEEGSITAGGLGLKRSFQRNLSQIPLTEADLVSEFMDLTAQLESVGYRVLLTVDEMDKLGTDGEKLQGFLNSIKQLFAIRSCSFVVSISTSASRHFLLRGIDIRDALDSSLDAVERIEELDFAELRSLFRRRGQNISDSQVLFCQALSGGLPREALRCARRIAAKSSAKQRDSTLDEMARLILDDEFDDLAGTLGEELRTRRETDEPLPIAGAIHAYRVFWRTSPGERQDTHAALSRADGAALPAGFKTRVHYYDLIRTLFCPGEFTAAFGGLSTPTAQLLCQSLAAAHRYLETDLSDAKSLLERIEVELNDLRLVCAKVAVT
jgi:hypothetical protein